MAAGFFAGREAAFAVFAGEGRAAFFAAGLAAVFGFEADFGLAAGFFFGAAALPAAALAGFLVFASAAFFREAPAACFAAALALGFDGFATAVLAAVLTGFLVARFVAIRGHPRDVSNARSV